MPIQRSLITEQRYGCEVINRHTRLLRVALAVEDSFSYWQSAQPGLKASEQAAIAFEQRWFGSKSMERVKTLLNLLGQRYASYPVPLTTLQQWLPQDWVTRQNLCHWHLQLADPSYRAFAGVFLPGRHGYGEAVVERDVVARWVREQFPDWTSATVMRMATSLISSAAEAGLCSSGSGQRRLSYPKVSDEALTYWLYLLRHVIFEGSLLENPYFRSVGLEGALLEERLTKLSGLSFSRMGDVHEFGWNCDNLQHWAIEQLELKAEAIRFEETGA